MSAIVDRPYGTPITLVLSVVELPSIHEWRKFVDIIAIVDEKAYSIGIRNIKIAKMGDLLMEAHLASIFHYPIGDCRPRIKGEVVRCTWLEKAAPCKEIMLEILSADGEFDQSWIGSTSNHASLKNALRIVDGIKKSIEFMIASTPSDDEELADTIERK